MNSNSKADEKIANFLAMTNTNNEQIAKKYLINSNWDESKAAGLYFTELQIKGENVENNNDFNINELLINRVNDAEGNRTNDRGEGGENRDEGFFKRWVISPIQSVFSIFSWCKESVQGSSSLSFFLRSKFPNVASELPEFLRETNEKNLGILIVFVHWEEEKFVRVFEKILQCGDVRGLLRRAVVYCGEIGSHGGRSVVNALNILDSSNSSIIFYYNRENSHFLQENCLIKKLSGQQITYEIIKKELLFCKGKLREISNDLEDSSLSGIMEEQNLNMKMLEEELKQKQQLSKQAANSLKAAQKLEEEKVSEAEIRRQKIKEKAKEAKIKLKKEPSEKDKNSTVICFRFPDGVKRVERRFLVSDTIKDLYDFVDSLGEEIYEEEEYNGYGLYQPFPPKKYEKLNNTLESEGLITNVIIQIKENL